MRHKIEVRIPFPCRVAPRSHLAFTGILLAIFLISGCGPKTDDKDKNGGLFSWFHYATRPVSPDDEVGLTDKAVNYFVRGRYILAEEIFQKIRDRYPFSPYATLAELRLADCKFYMGLYEKRT